MMTNIDIPLPSQPKLVLIYRPRRDGRLSLPCLALALYHVCVSVHRPVSPVASDVGAFYVVVQKTHTSTFVF